MLLRSLTSLSFALSVPAESFQSLYILVISDFFLSVILFSQNLYNQRLKIRVAQNANIHVIAVRGEGSEPKVEFTSSVLEFGPILPHSTGDEKELTVQNPSSFPVEIYSLEFDKQYLEEEKVNYTHIYV